MIISDDRLLADPARLRVLAGIDFDNPGLRATLDGIAGRTAARTGLPVSLVTLVLNTAQLNVGTSGLDNWIAVADGTPIEWSFCACAVTTGRPYVIPDTTASEQATNPLVTQDGILSYAGVPITLDGQVVGAHCVLGSAPHRFTDQDLTALEAAATEITTVLEAFSDRM
jgi:GAF domain-containing protein